MSYCNIDSRIEKRRQILRRKQSIKKVRNRCTKNRNIRNETRRLSNSNYWKQIHEFPNYFINPSGDIYSKHLHRLLKASPDKQGYRRVTLYNSKGIFNRTVHPLVLEHFHGPRPTVNGKRYVGRHLDGNPLNNHISNLRWSTQSENLRDKNKHGTAVRGDSHPGSCLSSSDIPIVRALHTAGHSISAIARVYSVSRATIRNITTGNSWAHITTASLQTDIPQPLGRTSAPLTTEQQSVIANAVQAQSLTLTQLSTLYALSPAVIKEYANCTQNLNS